MLLQGAACRQVIIQTLSLVPADTYTETSHMATLDDLDRSKFTVQKRDLNTPQVVQDAALYILHPYMTPLTPCVPDLATTAKAELQAHMSVLRNNPSATFLFIPRMLPEPSGVASASHEVQQRLHDLINTELGLEGILEIAEAIDMVESVHDEYGKLSISRHLRCQNGTTAGFQVVFKRSPSVQA